MIMPKDDKQFTFLQQTSSSRHTVNKEFFNKRILIEFLVVFYLFIKLFIYSKICPLNISDSFHDKFMATRNIVLGDHSEIQVRWWYNKFKFIFLQCICISTMIKSKMWLRACAYQGVSNISFSENFTYVLNR